ncbi:MAG: fibronectin type III domain-containing protein [Patescibacteria group bacterium]
MKHKHSIIATLLLALLGIGQPMLSDAQVLLQISNVRTQVTENNVTITWDTNLVADAKIDIGTDTTYGTFFISTDKPDIRHTMQLHGLNEDTVYYFKLTSRSANQEITTFGQTFKTGETNDTTMPAISKVNVVAITGSTATIQWVTDEPASSVVRYGETSRYTATRSSGTKTIKHDVTLTGLRAAAVYHFQVSSADKDGNTAVDTDRTFQTWLTNEGDALVLELSDIRPLTTNDPQVKSNSLTISWRTNKLASGIVRYGEGTGLNKTITIPDVRTFEHQYTIEGLKPGTAYSFQIESKDIGGKSKRSETLSFVTRSVSSTTASGQRSETGMTFYARFDGNTSADFAAGNSESSQAGSVVVTAAGKTGGAALVGNKSQLRYDGPENLGIDETAVAFWVKTAWKKNDGLDHVIFSLNPYAKAGSDKYIGLAKWKDFGGRRDVLEFGLEDARDADTRLFADDDLIADGAWHFVVLQWKFGGDASFYIDGELQARGSLGGTPPALGTYFYLGNEKLDTSVFFDEFIIFDRVLSEGEVKTVMGGGIIALEGGASAVSVLGFSTEGLTVPQGLYQVPGDRDIYAFFHGERYRIPGPTSLERYTAMGFTVRGMTAERLYAYPLVHLVKADDSDAVYYLYYKSEGKILKIGVPSPDIFESYARNDWADVVAIDGADLARYQDATLVKSVSNPAVYRIENGQARPFESENAFMRLGYDFQDIVDINDAHLSTYRRGQPVR